MKQISIEEALLTPEKIDEESWLCLPPTPDEWTLSTVAILSLDSSEFAPDSDEYLPKEVKEDGWVEVLDRNTIEEIVFNAGEYNGERTLDELLKAFIYYFKNDAFIVF